MKEKDIQSAILQYLKLNKIFHYRNNTGGFRDYRNHFYRFGALGSPDIVCVVKGKYLAIEVKNERGKQTRHQKEFQDKLEEAGGIYILTRSLDELIDKTKNIFKI